MRALWVTGLDYPPQRAVSMFSFLCVLEQKSLLLIRRLFLYCCYSACPDTWNRVKEEKSDLSKYEGRWSFNYSVS